MWKVFVAFNVILFMTGLCSADVDEDHSRSKRFILGGDGINLETVRKSLIDPSTISNQLTGAIVFPSIMVFGWLTGGENDYYISRQVYMTQRFLKFPLFYYVILNFPF